MKKYKDEDHGGFAIKVGSFDIEGEMERPRTMEDGNKLLHTMGLQTSSGEKDNYMVTEVKERTILVTYGTYFSTFTTSTLPLADEKLIDILSQHQNTIPSEILECFTKITSRKKGNILQQ